VIKGKPKVEARRPVSIDTYLKKLERGEYYNDPGEYVRDVFEDPQNRGLSVEPDVWQDEVLGALPSESQLAVASGHGPGKSALSAWIIHWFIATRDHPQIVVTANTNSQLTKKTWRELKKWNDRAVNGNHFKWTATSFAHKADPGTWFAAAIPWSEHNSEAFAGTHETQGVLILFDEASAIADVIWEVASGAMTTEGAKWLCFGNPTRNTGRFRECFPGGREAHRWWTKQVDSRTARMTDKVKLQEWEDDWGEDSDYFRVRVRGVFPRQSTDQFISSEVVDEAFARVLMPQEYYHGEKVIGVDVAKGGENGDRHGIVRRQGRKMWKVRPIVGIDTMGLVAAVVDEYNLWNADVVCVDGTGVGTGVVSRLKELNIPVIDVMVGSNANDPIQYFNLKTELYGLFRDWLRYGDLEMDEDLKKELIAYEFDHTNKMQLRLEPKKYVKQRLGFSPDLAVTAVLTMAAEGTRTSKVRALPVVQRNSNGWWRFR
jgi:hypothetical protein